MLAARPWQGERRRCSDPSRSLVSPISGWLRGSMGEVMSAGSPEGRIRFRRRAVDLRSAAYASIKWILDPDGEA